MRADSMIGVTKQHLAKVSAQSFRYKLETADIWKASLTVRLDTGWKLLEAYTTLHAVVPPGLVPT
jgi:hypothetical protein